MDAVTATYRDGVHRPVGQDDLLAKVVRHRIACRIDDLNRHTKLRDVCQRYTRLTAATGEPELLKQYYAELCLLATLIE